MQNEERIAEVLSPNCRILNRYVRSLVTHRVSQLGIDLKKNVNTYTADL